MSIGVKTKHIRQPLNNHTRPFYLPELMFNVRNTVSSLSGRHDTTGAGLGGGVQVARADRACYPGYAAKDSAFETSTQITRDVSIPVGY